MPTQTLTTDTGELNKLYNHIVKEHQDYLDRLREAFDKRCEEIRLEAHKKLEAIPESRAEERQKVLDEEKAELDKTLNELKVAMQQSSREARKKLEQIETRIDETTMNLEAELSRL